MSVDLPALGKPTRPTSASSFSSSRRSLIFAGFAGLRLARRAVGRRREARVAEAAAPALGDEHALAFFARDRRAVERMLGVAGLLVDERADRHGELEVVAVCAGAVGALAVLAAFGAELGVKADS